MSSFRTFYVFASCFRTLAVILVSVFYFFQYPSVFAAVTCIHISAAHIKTIRGIGSRRTIVCMDTEKYSTHQIRWNVAAMPLFGHTKIQQHQIRQNVAAMPTVWTHENTATLDQTKYGSRYYRLDTRKYSTALTSNSKHWFTTHFLQPLPYLVTSQVHENCQLTSSFSLVLKQQ